MDQMGNKPYPVFSRNFQVDYYEKEEKLWHITSHLKDHVHDILVTLDICAEDMIIQDAAVQFIRYPLEGCLKFVDKMKKLVGANLFEDFRARMIETMLGPEGCPNAMNLVSIAAPAFIFFYYPDQVCRGRMKHEDWWNMTHTKLAGNCIAH
jgi:hypothetical protein